MGLNLEKGILCMAGQEPMRRKKRISASLSKPVLMIDKITDEVLKEFNSTTEAEKYLNAKGHHVSCCCNNERKTAYGYKWKYKERG